MSYWKKIFLRGSAKGTTAEGDVTSTNVDANTQAMDVVVKNTITATVDTSLLATKDNQTNGTQRVAPAFGYTIDGALKVNGFTLAYYNFYKNLLPNIFNTAGTGTATWVAQALRLTVTSGQFVVGQSNYFHRYIPGNPQEIELTVDNAKPTAGVSMEWGYGSDSTVSPFSGSYDGFRFRTDNTTTWVEVLKNGVVVHQKARADWDNPITGYDFDNFTVTAIDYLYLGGLGCRWWVNVSGLLIPVYTYLYAGTSQGTFVTSPCLPVRVALRSTSVSKTFNFFCARVKSLGTDNDELGEERTFDNGSTGMSANTIGTTYAILGVRLKTANLNSIVRLVEAIPFVNSADTAKFSVLVNPTVAGTFTYTDVTNEAYQIATGATANTVTGGIEIAKSYSGQANIVNVNQQSILAQLGSTIAGVAIPVVFCVTPLSANVTTLGALKLKTY